MRRNSMSGYSRHFAEKAKPNNNDKIVRMPHGMVLNSYCVFSLELVIFISKVHTYINVLILLGSKKMPELESLEQQPRYRQI